MALTQQAARLGPFTLLDTLGRGGMATVYRATDAEGRVVALKVMDAGDATFVARFQREARISSMLDHPHVVRVHSFGEADGQHYLASELVEGGTLARLVRRGQRLPAPVAVEFTCQLLEGLAHAHAKGVVHRDLKPANLLVSNEGQLKVADFGIARAADDTNLTQTGTITGTARYMSPEQVLGGTIDARSDLFAAGVILYELLGGAPPTGDDGPETSLARLLSKQLKPLLELNPLVPAALVRIVEQLMAWDVSDRFASAGKALEALTPLRSAAALAHRALTADYVRGADAMSVGLLRAEAAGFLTRAKSALAEHPPGLEAAALNVHLALELSPMLDEAQALQRELSSKVNFKIGPSQNPRVLALEQQLTAQPHDSQILSQLTQLYRTEGNLLRAAQCMRRYVALRPDDTYMGKQLARLAGDDWVPTLVFRAKPASSTAARPPTAARPASTGVNTAPTATPVIVYADAPAASSHAGLIKWVVLALGVVLVGVGVRTAIRSLERAEEARFKQMEVDSQREAARLLELQRITPAALPDVSDAGDF